MAIVESMTLVELEAQAESELRLFNIEVFGFRFVLVNIVAFLVALLRVLLPQLQQHQQRRAHQLREEQEAAAEAAAQELLAQLPTNSGQKAKLLRPQRQCRQASKRLGAATKKGRNSGNAQVECSNGNEQIEDAPPATQSYQPVVPSIDQEMGSFQTVAQIDSHPDVCHKLCPKVYPEVEDNLASQKADASVEVHFFQQITLPNWDAFEDVSDHGRESSEPDVSKELLSEHSLGSFCGDAADHVSDNESECAISGLSDSDVDASGRLPTKVDSSCASTQSLVDDDERFSSSEDEVEVGQHSCSPSIDQDCRVFAAAVLLSRRPATLQQACPDCIGHLKLREVYGLPTAKAWGLRSAKASTAWVAKA